jgi:hypothetical protein
MTPEALMHCTPEIHSHQRRFAWRICSHHTIQMFRLPKRGERQSQQQDQPERFLATQNPPYRLSHSLGLHQSLNMLTLQSTSTS